MNEMSSFRQALLHFGLGTWAFVDGVLVQTARGTSLVLRDV